MPEFSHPVFGSVGHAEQPSQQKPLEEPQMKHDDLSLLIECGKITDTVEINGLKFRMSTLSDERQEAIFKKFSSTLSDAGSFVELRRTVVAMAIETVNDLSLESRYPADAPVLDTFGMKLAIVSKMQGQVIDRLYAFYEELLKRSKQAIDPEQVKN